MDRWSGIVHGLRVRVGIDLLDGYRLKVVA